MYIEITAQHDVEEVAKNIRNFYFRDVISLEEFTNLIEHMDPDQYVELYYRDIMKNVKEVLPDSLVELLTTSNIKLEHIIRNNKVSDAMVQNIIDNHINEVDGEYLISNQNVTFEQFKTIIHNGTSVYTESLGSVIGDLRNVEYAMYIIQNWDSISALADDDIDEFRYPLFNGFGSVLLTDAESIALFGFVRPSMSSNILRDHEPCSDGWKRAYKWAGRNDTMYSWNEFIARHILANQDAVSDAKSDLEWLAESASDDRDFFHQW